jgi:hypothetical protein
VKSAGGDEQDVVGANHAVARVDGGSFDDGENVTLHTLARDVWAVTGFASRNFVDFVDKDDAHLFRAFDGHACNQVHIQQLVFFFLDQVFERVGDAHFALFLLLAEDVGKHLLDVAVHFLDALIGNDFECGHQAFAHLQVDHALIELAFAKLDTELFARAQVLLTLRGDLAFRRAWGGRRQRRQQQIEHALFRRLFGAVSHFIELFLADHVDGSLDEVADHGLDVAADVAHFGVFRSFHLDERASGQPRQTPGNLGFPHARRPDHQNVFRQDIVRDFGRKLLPTNAIAQRHGDSALRGRLPDDVFVELEDDLARRHVVQRGKKLLFFAGDRAVATGRDNDFLFGLSGHPRSQFQALLVSSFQ